MWQRVDANHKCLQNQNYLCRERSLYDWSHLEETAEFAGLLIALMAKRSRAVPTTWQSGRGIKGGQQTTKYDLMMKGVLRTTWSTAPLKFEMPGPGKVTNIPAVAFAPST